MVMLRPSAFSVYIKGEVSRAEERTTWAMGRLSSLLNSSTLSEYSSIRTITVTSIDGQTKTYDLFKARRFGDLSQDPYLRPGDTITVSHLDRKVSVYGHIERPGSYELLPGENIRDLIVKYANGYTSRADIDRVELTRFVENNEAVGDTIYLTQEAINANYPLQHSDAVYVPPKMP
jgi:protein involved in polysaccharide export with SLBB domain